MTKKSELNQIERQFLITFEQAAVGIAHVGIEGGFMRINSKFCEIVGYSQQEMLKLTFQDITFPEDLSLDMEYAQQLLEGKIETYSLEKRYIRKDKSIVWINLTVSLVRKEAKEPEFFISFVEDITARKQAENIFEILIDQAGDAFFVLDYNGSIFDVNIEACKSLGYSREELLSMNISEIDIEVIDMKHKQQFWNSLEPRQYVTLEGVHSHKNGSTFPVEVRLGRMDLRGKKFLLALARDITERKQKEEELKKRVEFQELVSKTSTKFSGLSGVEFETAIHDSLSEIGKYFNSDTVRLYRLSPHGDVLKIRNMWRSEELAPMKEMPEILSLKYPDMAAHYSKGESIVFSNYNDSPQWPVIRKILKFFGTKAGVGVPLESDKSGVDIFAMDKVLTEYTWPKEIIMQSKVIGKVLLSAMRRWEAEIEIQKGYSEIERLKDQLHQENLYLKEEIKGIKNFDTIIGQSKALKYVLFRVEQVAPTDTTVLVSGETGTGKEVFTNALHQLSLRNNKTLVKVNCAALSPTLIESELFGHEKGAFTGANEKRIGRFELADGGTIFLDEISELSLEVQAKLLRVLQEGEFERLGSSKTIKVNVRIIAATNRNLEEEVKNNRFRVDLYYRISTFIITIPPLRDRQEDIPLLVKFLVNKLGKKLNKSVKKVPNAVMRKLVNYSWPGNVRELENVIENALIITNGEILKVEIPGGSNLTTLGKSKLEDLEREHIIKTLDSVNWQIGGKNGAAERLGLKRTTLNSKMKKHNINKTSK